MTTKQQRTAYNLTKLAEAHDFESAFDPTFLALQEIAKDAGIATIDGKQYGIDHFVFIPQKDWDKACERVEIRKHIGLEDAERPFKDEVEYWNEMAGIHKF